MSGEVTKQIVYHYRGYTLEMTDVAVDVITPNRSMYLATKVSIREAMRAIHWHRRFISTLDLDRQSQMP